MLEKNPFKIQELKRKERKAIILNLLETLFKANYEITVLCKKNNGLMKTKNYIAKNKVYYMYLIEKLDQIDGIATLLKGCSNWHYNIFVIIVGRKGLNESLQKIDYSKSVPDMENNLDTNILGYMFPVDGDLLFYGDQDFKKLIET